MMRKLILGLCAAATCLAAVGFAEESRAGNGPLKNGVPANPSDLGIANIRFDKEEFVKAPACLYVVDADDYFAWKIADGVQHLEAGRIQKGSGLLVGRCSGDVCKRTCFKPVSFTRNGNKIEAVVEYSNEGGGTEKSAYFQAKLPKLPPGRYMASVRFVHNEDDLPAEIALPACEFTVPAVNAEGTAPTIPANVQVLILAVATRPASWPGRDFPERPPLGDDVERGIFQELTENRKLRESFYKLNANLSNNVWFEGIQELTAVNAVWCLAAGLCHSHDDVQILCARALGSLQDRRPVPLLLRTVKAFAVHEEGSENATLRGVFQHALAEALNQILGTTVKLKDGQDPEGLKQGVEIWRRVPWAFDTWGETTAGLRVGLQTFPKGKIKFSPDQPLQLVVTVKNEGKEKVTLFDAAYPYNWKIKLFSAPSGKGAWFTLYPEKDRVPDKHIVLPPGATVEIPLAADRFTSPLSETHKIVDLNNLLAARRWRAITEYEHPADHKQSEPCPYWHGKITTGAVEIEIVAPKESGDAADAINTQIERFNATREGWRGITPIDRRVVAVKYDAQADAVNCLDRNGEILLTLKRREDGNFAGEVSTPFHTLESPEGLRKWGTVSTIFTLPAALVNPLKLSANDKKLENQ